LPTAAEDHQTKNAEAITNSGAGILVSDAAIENSITEIINRLLSQPDEVKKMGMAAARSGRTDATKKIADIILNDAQQI
jgi:UDP-N-acetylglucosamine--N-acetylmuramyl-(pentapeptide) pyrophosphoryl-undecaprenol N-acetylglucosamine transferase